MLLIRGNEKVEVVLDGAIPAYLSNGFVPCEQPIEVEKVEIVEKVEKPKKAKKPNKK